MRIKLKDSYNLLFNNLWQVDENKLKQMDVKPHIRDWSLTGNVLPKQDAKITQTPPLKLLAKVEPASVNNLIVDKPDTPATDLKISTQPQSIDKPVQHQLITSWSKLENLTNNCTLCKLSKGRNSVVLERGNRQAKCMFIGEAPGYDEDMQGSAFVGASGQLLNKMISAMGLNPQNDVYICNVIKCRPPSNRNPEHEEIELCKNYLFSQIKLVSPQIIITLGRFASQTLLSTNLATTRLRGKVHNFENIPVIVSYHPSYLLRNPAAKKDAWDDLQLAMREFKQ